MTPFFVYHVPVFEEAPWVTKRGVCARPRDEETEDGESFRQQFAPAPQTPKMSLDAAYSMAAAKTTKQCNAPIEICFGNPGRRGFLVICDELGHGFQHMQHSQLNKLRVCMCIRTKQPTCPCCSIIVDINPPPSEPRTACDQGLP